LVDRPKRFNRAATASSGTSGIEFDRSTYARLCFLRFGVRNRRSVLIHTLTVEKPFEYHSFKPHCFEPRLLVAGGGKMLRNVFVWAMFALALICAPKAHAQAVTVASVGGLVTDQSGSAVPAVAITMTETEKGVVHSTISDAEGRYSFPTLPVGPYRLEAKGTGFKDYVQTGLVLQVAANIVQNIQLQLGSVTETVEVQSAANMVETKENSISQVIEQRKIVDLPLNGRNLTQLLTLTGAGTTAPGGDLVGSKNMQGSAGSGTFSVAGSQANGVSYLLDGGDNNDAFSNVNLPLPFPDAVQEFSVQTNGVSAQYGLHPGGVVNIVTKSGANAMHGDVFEFLRNYDLNARQRGAAARDSLKRNQFGGVIGGHIIKDKLFFFAGYQGTRQRTNPTATQAHVPTAAALNGDFSALAGATATGGCRSSALALKDPLTGNPFPGNQIPTSRFDPAAVKLVKNYIPVSSDPCGLFLYGQPGNNPDDQVVGRVDYVASEKHMLYGRYFVYNYTAQTFYDGKNALTTGPNPGNRDRSNTATFGDTYTFTPTKVNSFHATFNRRADNRGSASNLFSPGDLGINMFQNLPNYIQLSVSNYFNVACGTCAPGYFNVNTFQVSDDFTWIRGRHQFAFGVDGRKQQFNSTNNQQANGQISFNGGTTGDALADLLIGRMSNFTDGNALSDYMRQTVFAAYAQDNFKINQHLTLNFGLRWEPELPAIDKYGRGNQFSFPLFTQGVHSQKYPTAPAGLLFDTDPQNTHGKTFTQSHWDAVSPRLGMVWDPTGDGKQTIRSSVSIIHDSTELFYPERWTTNPPYASSISLSNPTAPLSNPWLGYPGGNPFPGAAIFPVTGVYVTIPPDVHATYELKWNVSYQRQIGADWRASINYLGTKTNHILGAREINEAQNYLPGATTGNTNQRRITYLINPAQGQYYASIIQTDDGNVANYNGLLFSLEHRFSKNFTWLVNYTWSRCMSTYDFGGELAGNNYQDPNNRRAEYGPCNFNRTQIFNTSLVVISPGAGHGAAKYLTKDWKVSPIVSAYTGQPFSVTDGGTDISLTGVGADRPNVVMTGTGVLPHTTSAWFNPAAFARQAAGMFGNSGRDNINAPGAYNWDMAVSREFHPTERMRLEFRADVFNVLNHANWNAPSASITSAQFGQITSFGAPRLMQGALKLYF
jgi:hypothetical protein